jgi:hypothetical protein
MKKLFAALLLATGVYSNALAQGGSNYSNFGIGDIYDNISARYEGLAGTGIAVPSDYSINLENPAMWSMVSSTRIQVGYLFNQYSISDEKYNLKQNNGGVNQILGLFSIDTAKGISIAFGIMPYSTVRYLVEKQEKVNAGGVEYNGKSLYTGAGGISEAFLGASYRPFNRLRIGASACAYFGGVKKKVNTYFLTSDNGFNEIVYGKSDFVKGIGMKLGFAYEPVDNFYLGAYWNKNFNMSVDNQKYYDYLSSSDSTQSAKFDINLPDAFGVGVAYKYEKFIFAADYSAQDFSNFDYEKGFAEFKNSMNLSLGVSRLGNRTYKASVWDKITYNFGVGYRQLYYSVFGKDINEYYASVGFDIPVVGSAMLNTAVTAGIRGQNSGALVKEAFAKLNVNISLGEVWFKPFEQDY